LPPSDAALPTEPRRDFRASFAPSRRPLLHLPDGVHQVLDVTVRGLRIRHTHPVRPALGAKIAGTLMFVDQRPPQPLTGIIIRVQAADVAILCADGTFPEAWVMEEAAHARGSMPDSTKGC
jgi:hypothetical protein